MSDASSKISETLRTVREAKNIRQSTLARTIGIDPGHLSRIETGKLVPTMATLNEIARALDLEIMLVPRQSVPAVRALTDREKTNIEMAAEGKAKRESAVRENSVPPAYRLDAETDDE